MEEKSYSWAILYKDGSLKHIVDIEKDTEDNVIAVGVSPNLFGFGLHFTLDTAKKVQEHWNNVEVDGILVTVPGKEAYEDWQEYIGDEIGKKQFKHMEKFGGLTIDSLDKVAKEQRQKEIESGIPPLVTHKSNKKSTVKVSEITKDMLLPTDKLKDTVAKSTKLPVFEVDSEEDNQRYVFISKRDVRLSLQLMNATVSDFVFITLLDYTEINESERFTKCDIINEGFNPDDFWSIPAEDKQKLTVKDLIEVIQN